LLLRRVFSVRDGVIIEGKLIEVTLNDLNDETFDFIEAASPCRGDPLLLLADVDRRISFLLLPVDINEGPRDA
jgi:hypothetical protein